MGIRETSETPSSDFTLGRAGVAGPSSGGADGSGRVRSTVAERGKHRTHAAEKPQPVLEAELRAFVDLETTETPFLVNNFAGLFPLPPAQPGENNNKIIFRELAYLLQKPGCDGNSAPPPA
jgi:hypothetical protein